MGPAKSDEPARLCVAIVSSKASEKALSDVVAEIGLWQPGGLPIQLHLVHVALLRQDDKTSDNTVQQEVKRFMDKRFVPILNRLPETCDWNLHVVTITPPVISGDTNRSTNSNQDKKYLAAALCREAEKLGATELVVNMHDKQEHRVSTKPLAQKVIKYSKIPVRVVGPSESEVHLGKGKPHHLLGAEADSQAEVQRQLEKDSAGYPEDKTDAYSSYKRVVKGVKHLFRRSSGHKATQERQDPSSSSSDDSPTAAVKDDDLSKETLGAPIQVSAGDRGASATSNGSVSNQQAAAAK